MNSTLIASLIILASGALGGFLSYLMPRDEEHQTLEWWKYIVLGIGAAFVVPLLLNMISSDLLVDVVTPASGTAEANDKYFVLSGFCIVSAVSARTFLQTLSKGVLQQIRAVNEEVEEAREVAAKARAQSLIATDFMDEPDDEEQLVNTVPLTKDEKKVINEMVTGKYAMRSVSGLAKSIGLTKEVVNESITSLTSKKLVEKGENSRSQERWYPSQTGRKVVHDQAVTNA